MYHDFNIIPDLLLKVEMTLELNKQVLWKQKINILQMSFRFYWVKIHSQQFKLLNPNYIFANFIT